MCIFCSCILPDLAFLFVPFKSFNNEFTLWADEVVLLVSTMNTAVASTQTRPIGSKPPGPVPLLSSATEVGESKLMALPTELHLLISKHLTYPDALALKHTSRHFYGIVYTGVHLKIEWLIERRTLHLDCPHDKSCELGSDLRFCRGSVK
jgi:hypothetical protein